MQLITPMPHILENLHHQQPKSIAHPMPKAGKPSNPPQVQIIKYKPSIHTHNQIKKNPKFITKTMATELNPKPQIPYQNRNHHVGNHQPMALKPP